MEDNHKPENEILKYVFPLYSVIPVSKVAGKITGNINKGRFFVNVSNKKKVETIVNLHTDFDQLKEYSQFERSIHDIICSFYESGVRYFTDNQAARYLEGTNNINPRKETVKKIQETIRQLSLIKIELDLKEEIEHFNYSGITLEKIEKQLINVNRYVFKIKKGGNIETVTGWELLEEPVLLWYSKLKKQVVRINNNLRNIQAVNGKRIMLNNNRIAIRDYLLRRIYIMKKNRDRAAYFYNKQQKQEGGNASEKTPIEGESGERLSNVILYQSIFKECGLNSQNKKSRMRNIAYIKRCLDYWRRQEIISTYKNVSGARKNTVKGVRLFF